VGQHPVHGVVVGAFKGQAVAAQGLFGVLFAVGQPGEQEVAGLIVRLEGQGSLGVIPGGSLVAQHGAGHGDHAISRVMARFVA